MTTDPHRNQPVRFAGVPLSEATSAMILLHGRGASAEDILSLAGQLQHRRMAYLAPQAASHTWYPFSFMAPRSENEPWLSSALSKVADTLKLVLESGLSQDRIVVCGFSQGACLASEFIASNPGRYGAMIAFTGGLIGATERDLQHEGKLSGTPALFSSGDPDPHVPWSRVIASAEQFTRMGAEVQIDRHSGRPHTISPAEMARAAALLAPLFRDDGKASKPPSNT